MKDRVSKNKKEKLDLKEFSVLWPQTKNLWDDLDFTVTRNYIVPAAYTCGICIVCYLHGSVAVFQWVGGPSKEVLWWSRALVKTLSSD